MVQKMSRFFNITGDCKPNYHYMVNIQPKLNAIKKMIDQGEYFTINRARQYGKTTTLRALKEYLKDEYYVVSMDFQMQMSYAKFRDENTFSIHPCGRESQHGYCRWDEDGGEHSEREYTEEQRGIRTCRVISVFE